MPLAFPLPLANILQYISQILFYATQPYRDFDEMNGGACFVSTIEVASDLVQVIPDAGDLKDEGQKRFTLPLRDIEPRLSEKGRDRSSSGSRLKEREFPNPKQRLARHDGKGHRYLFRPPNGIFEASTLLIEGGSKGEPLPLASNNRPPTGVAGCVRWLRGIFVSQNHDKEERKEPR